MKLHFVWLTVFLIVAHVAMIFGMVNPQIVMKAVSGGMTYGRKKDWLVLNEDLLLS